MFNMFVAGFCAAVAFILIAKRREWFLAAVNIALCVLNLWVALDGK